MYSSQKIDTHHMARSRLTRTQFVERGTLDNGILVCSQPLEAYKEKDRTPAASSGLVTHGHCIQPHLQSCNIARNHASRNMWWWTSAICSHFPISSPTYQSFLEKQICDDFSHSSPRVVKHTHRHTYLVRCISVCVAPSSASSIATSSRTYASRSRGGVWGSCCIQCCSILARL